MKKLPQEHGDGVQAMLGRRGDVRRGLHMADYRGGTKFQGDKSGTDALPRVREVTEKGFLVVHRQNQHRVAKGGLGQEGDEEAGGDEPSTYMIAFPAKAGPRP